MLLQGANLSARAVSLLSHVFCLLLVLFSVRNRLREIVGASTNWRYRTIIKIHNTHSFQPEDLSPCLLSERLCLDSSQTLFAFLKLWEHLLIIINANICQLPSCVSVSACANAPPLQRPSAGHGGARLAVLHAGQVPGRPSLQEDEGQLPGGPPAAGLRAAAPREIPDLPRHGPVGACTDALSSSLSSTLSNLSLNPVFQVWKDPGGPGQSSRFP